MRFSREALSSEILDIFSREKDRHKNKYNVLGRSSYHKGTLSTKMGVDFSEEERQLAYQCFNEIESRGLIRPTYTDLSNPRDWYVITPLGEKALSTGALDELDEMLINIESEDNLVQIRR